MRREPRIRWCQFSVRALMLWALVTGLAIGWYFDNRSKSMEIRKLRAQSSEALDRLLVQSREVDALRAENDYTRQIVDDVYVALRKKGFSVKLDIEATDELKIHEQFRLRLKSLDMPKLVEQLHAKIQELEAKLDESSNTNHIRSAEIDKKGGRTGQENTLGRRAKPRIE